MNSYYMYYAACGSNGLVIYENFDRCKKNGGAYLGDRFHYKGFDDYYAAIEWVKKEYSKIHPERYSANVCFMKLNQITFTKNMPYVIPTKPFIVWEN